MARSIEHDPNVLTGSRLEQLATAFDRVRDPRDWKAPIEWEIPASERSGVRMRPGEYLAGEDLKANSAGRP